MESIQIFSNPQFGDVRTAGTPENPLFCLADVCKVLDLQPSRVKDRLDDGVTCSKGIIDSLGRMQQANFITEDGLYDVILDSRKPEAKAFRKWMTSEVIPSIRKHGAYMTKETLREALLTPDFLIKLANELKDEKEANKQLHATNDILTEQNRALEDQNRKMLPKAEYCDKVIQSVDGLTFTQVAKDLGMTSAVKLQSLLEEKKIIFRQSGQWLPYAKYSEKGFFTFRSRFYVDLKTQEVKTKSYLIVTELGRAWMHKMFDKAA